MARLGPALVGAGQPIWSAGEGAHGELATCSRTGSCLNGYEVAGVTFPAPVARGIMEIAYTEDQIALRDRLRAYFTELMTPEVAEECDSGDTGGPASLAAVRKMGADGLLGLGWSTRYGGQGATPIEQFIFINESWRAGAPTPFLSINTVGTTIQEFGTDEQKDFFLPRILAGDLHFSIGYTEPGSGTDLASLTTRAVKDGDDWIINGQKTFTSLANYADYIWLAARTNPDAPKHRGITIFAVPTSDPGYSFQKISTMVNASTFQTFYDDVKVPASAVIGEVDHGWDLIVNQLNYERVSLAPPGSVERVYSQVLEWEACDNHECATLEVPIDYRDAEGLFDLGLLEQRARIAEIAIGGRTAGHDEIVLAGGKDDLLPLAGAEPQSSDDREASKPEGAGANIRRKAHLWLL